MLSYDENVTFPQLPSPPFAPHYRTECRAIRRTGKSEWAIIHEYPCVMGKADRPHDTMDGPPCYTPIRLSLFAFAIP